MQITPSDTSALIVQSLVRSRNDIPLALKQRMAELIIRMQGRRTEPFGLFVILGWQDRWQEFAVTPDLAQDIFRGHNVHQPTEERRRITTTLNFDGAILIDRNGDVLHSGVMIEGLRPREIAARLNPGQFSDLSAQFGFEEKVHTRHLSAIAASYKFKGTTVITVSEESGSIHIFEDGKILYTSKRKSRK